MAIHEELTVSVRRALRRKGNTVYLEFGCADNYTAIQLQEKLLHDIWASGGVALRLQRFDEITEQEGGQ